MGLVAQINQAVVDARIALGDLVISTTLKKAGAKVYDTSTGQYTILYTDVPIDAVNDKFDYNEMSAADFDSNNVKLTVFNNAAMDLVITPSDKIVWSGIEYMVYKIQRNYVGPTVPVFTVYLRK